MAALAAVVSVSLASAASGETSNPAPTTSEGKSEEKAPAKGPSHTKRKKHRLPSGSTKGRRAVTTASPRSTSRLTLAASADIAARTDALIDVAQLPPVAGGACPPEMASIEQRFCVDRWEASLVERTPTGEKPFSPFLVVDGHDVRAASVRGVFPQGYISGTQAQAACEGAGKRLCSTNEWRKACIGPQAQLYGYAKSHERGRCNDAGRSPMLSLFGGSLGAVSDWDPLKMNDPRLNQLDGALARTGSHPSCTNDYGVFDMVGNLHEWTSDPHGTFQGGYYLDTSINGEGCSYRTTAHDFDYHDYSTGFRCCADPR
jgi:sulfatase modifying factor 1